MGDIYAILTALCWSSAVILFDISSKKFEALQLNAIKNLIGVCGFFVTIIVFSIPLPKFSSDELIILIISGFLGITIADVLFLESLKRMGSGISALVSTIYTPSIFILAFILFNETIAIQSYLGGLIVISGIVITVYKVPRNITRENLYIGICLGILAQFFTAYSVLSVKPILEEHPILYDALYRFSVGLVGTIIICILKVGFIDLIQTYKNGLINYHLVLGAILGTYLSVILWLSGFKYTLAGRAAIYNQLSTVLIVIFARLFLSESLDTRKIIGVFLAMFGALLVTLVDQT